MEVKRFDSKEGNVWKYVFDFGDAIAEAVLYRYDSFYKRTVICCSVMSGCPIGCKFCGTGKQFIRNLTQFEIAGQIKHILRDMNIEDVNETSEKFQIMFMSMGEPLLNWEKVYPAIAYLNSRYPNAQLLVSTVGVNHHALRQLINLGKINDKVGLQFSIHEAWEEKRNKLIPYEKKLTLRQIRDIGIEWWKQTDRQVYLNFCVTPDNISYKDAHQKNIYLVNYMSETFLKAGYNTRVFDPAGQDDIGGGCGQLWYVQDWMKKKLAQ